MRIKIDGQFKMNTDTRKFLKKRNLESGGAVQRYIDTECLRFIEPYVPFRTGALTRSGQTLTKIGSGVIRYAPRSGGKKSYAARLYYNPQFNFNKAVHPQAGAYWFERMVDVRKNQILKGACAIAGARPGNKGT